MLFMVIESFRNQDGKAVYRRFRDKGRMMPDGLTFVGSWTAADLSRCFQIMETDDVTLLQTLGRRMGGAHRVRNRSGCRRQGDRGSARRSALIAAIRARSGETDARRSQFVDCGKNSFRRFDFMRVSSKFSPTQPSVGSRKITSVFSLPLSASSFATLRK